MKRRRRTPWIVTMSVLEAAIIAGLVLSALPGVWLDLAGLDRSGLNATLSRLGEGILAPLTANAPATPPPTTTATPDPDATNITISSDAVRSNAVTAAALLTQGNDWTQYRFDLEGTGLNPENIITEDNVASLTQRWAITGQAAYESTPAVVDGVIYIPNGRSLYAYDLLTGKTLWHYDGVGAGRGAVNSSPAVDPTTHLVYYGAPDGNIYAVDTETGQGVWHVRLGDPANGAYIWSSPLLVNGNVYIGLASTNDQPCVRGAVFALDAATGTQVWVHYTERAGHVGGGVWSSVTADVAHGEIIATSGNPCSTHDSDVEQDSIIGIDWNTGKTRWHYNALAYDDCDCDFAGGAVSYSVGGKDYIAAGNKYGGIYVLQRTGSSVKLAWRTRVALTDAEAGGGIYEPPAYADGIVYFAAGTPLDGSCDALYAYQANTGKLVWKRCTTMRLIAPAAITGGMLFIGQRDSALALDLKTGTTLWQANYTGQMWGGITIAHGLVIMGTVTHALYCYTLPTT